MNVYMLEEVIAAGEDSLTDIPLQELTKDDVIILNYTSGTTGPPKGVKVSAYKAIMGCVTTQYVCKITHEDVFISYLPSPHVFDQIVFGLVLMHGARVGYFHGDTAALTDDCQVLKPTIFPSVPRLLNKLY